MFDDQVRQQKYGAMRFGSTRVRVILALACHAVQSSGGMRGSAFMFVTSFPGAGGCQASDGICFGDQDMSDNAPVQLQCVGAVEACARMCQTSHEQLRKSQNAAVLSRATRETQSDRVTVGENRRGS
jgi:hypothetical protein